MGRAPAIAIGVAAAALIFVIAVSYGARAAPQSAWSSFRSRVLNGTSTSTYIVTAVTYSGCPASCRVSSSAVENVTYGLDLPDGRFYVHIEVLNSSPPTPFVQQTVTYWVNGSLMCFKAVALLRSGGTAVESNCYKGGEGLLLFYAPFAHLLLNMSGGSPTYNYFSAASIRYEGASTWHGQTTYCYSASIKTRWGSIGLATLQTSNETVCLLGDGVPATISAVETSRMAVGITYMAIRYNATLVSYEPNYLG